MGSNQGELLVYQAEDGTATVDVRLADETVWLTQNQMVTLFEKTKQNISLHIRNVFKEGELSEAAVVKEYLTTAADGKRYKTKYFNLDVIISVGYRVKSRRGTQFRIWATSVLKDHLVKGYTLNRKRLAEKGLVEARQMLELIGTTLDRHDMVNDEGRAVLDIVNNYARTWRLLWQYDEESLPAPKETIPPRKFLELKEACSAIASLKAQLRAKGEATDFFGRERGDGLSGILGAIRQSFAGQDLYPGVREKAAHLLYFLVKDHPFTDGNKRIASFLFLLFLRMNGVLEIQHLDARTLVALTLMTAASDPDKKDLLVRLIVNLLAEK
jgi:prophage maintenance system killer protein